MDDNGNPTISILRTLALFPTLVFPAAQDPVAGAIVGRQLILRWMQCVFYGFSTVKLGEYHVGLVGL